MGMTTAKVLTDSDLRIALGYASSLLPSGALPVSYRREAKLEDVPRGSLTKFTKEYGRDPQKFGEEYLAKNPDIVEEIIFNMESRGIKDPYGHCNPILTFSRE